MDKPNEALPPLDDELAALVGAYTEQTARDSGQVSAALQAVSAKTGVPSGSLWASLSTTVKVTMVSVVIGLVAVVAWPNARPEPSTTPPPQSEPDATDTPAAAPAPVVARVQGELPLPTPVVDDQAPSAEASRSPPEAPPPDAEPPVAVDVKPTVANERRLPPKRAPRQAGPEPVAAPPTLAAELELLRQARSALRANRHARVLEIVVQHRREYPDSKFAEERDATQIKALCASGRRAQAKRQASAYAARFPASQRDLLADCSTP